MTQGFPVVAPDAPTSQMVMALAAQSLERESGASFQSLLVASYDALERLTSGVRTAESAALCLAQREHAGAIARGLDETRAALGAGVTSGARCLSTQAPGLSTALRGLLRPDRQRIAEAARAVREAIRTTPEASAGWFAATTDAVESLGETATHIESLAVAQPSGSAARELGTVLVSFLRQSRDLLLSDIARLVD